MTTLTGILEFCACGHLSDRHKAGVGCTHVNQPSKDHAGERRCHCSRLRPNPQLPDAEAYLAKVLNHIVRKEGLDLSQENRADVLQVMRISLWRAGCKYDSRSHIRFGSFAAFETYNDAIDEIRSSRLYGRNGQHRLLSYEPVQEEAAAPAETYEFDLHRLAPGSRRLALALYDGKTTEEIAAALGLRSQEVAKRKRLLRDELTALGYKPVARLEEWSADQFLTDFLDIYSEWEDAA